MIVQGQRTCRTGVLNNYAPSAQTPSSASRFLASEDEDPPGLESDLASSMSSSAFLFFFSCTRKFQGSLSLHSVSYSYQGSFLLKSSDFFHLRPWIKTYDSVLELTKNLHISVSWTKKGTEINIDYRPNARP